MHRVQPTCGSIFRLVTTTNTYVCCNGDSRLSYIGQPVEMTGSLLESKLCIVKLYTITTIASATVVIMKKHYRSAL